MIAAVQLLPDAVGLAGMARSNDPLFSLQFALHPANLLQLCSPYLFQDRFVSYSHDPNEGNTHAMCLYCGAFCTVALAWLWMRRRELQERRLFLCAVFFFGLAALILAFGKYGVAYVFLAELPFLNKFRDSCRYIILVHLAMMILASFALSDMLKMLSEKVKIPWRKQWPLLVPLGISGATFAAAAWFLLVPHPGHPYATQLSSVHEAFFGLASIFVAVACCAAICSRTEVGRGGNRSSDLRGDGGGGDLAASLAECPAGYCRSLREHLEEWAPDYHARFLRIDCQAAAQNGRVLTFDTSNSIIALGGSECMDGGLHYPMMRLIPKATRFLGSEG